jgi:hypothetical protein
MEKIKKRKSEVQENNTTIPCEVGLTIEKEISKSINYKLLATKFLQDYFSNKQEIEKKCISVVKAVFKNKSDASSDRDTTFKNYSLYFNGIGDTAEYLTRVVVGNWGISKGNKMFFHLEKALVTGDHDEDNLRADPYLVCGCCLEPDDDLETDRPAIFICTEKFLLAYSSRMTLSSSINLEQICDHYFQDYELPRGSQER